MSNFSFPKMEEEILSLWQSSETFKKSLEQTQSQPNYIFYDGPPFATGLPHFGNLLAQTLKDIIPRYQTMQGYYVERRFGWDCHGLPIEHEINKQLNMDAHDALESLGIKAYNETCRGIVQKYAPQWQKTVERMGRWVDFENDYKTMDLSFMESVWWVFKSLWDKDLIYHGQKVVPYSNALGTPLANFEANSNYQMVQDPAITILAPLKDHPNRSLLLWTTTPWSLISNLAVTVHPDVTYAVVKDPNNDDKSFILAESLVSQVLGDDADIIETMPGQALVGTAYQPFYPYFKAHESQGAFRVLADTYVSAESGTGIVPNSPAFGEDDERICMAAGLPVDVCPLDESGKFTDVVTDFANQYIKDADANIIKDLKARDLLLRHDTLDHSYPFCPRTNTPLIYRSVPSWFVNVTKIKDKMIKNNQDIHWVPDHIQSGRFGKWLENARDWSISRNRVWGNPIPVWINDQTNKRICIGSIDELKSLTGETNITDIHREYIDHLTFEIDGEPGTYRRTDEVLDCWFESGAMPYAQLHYPFENETVFESGFPAQFIAEGLDQTRGWFYTLHIIASALFDQPAFKNVIVNGIILAESGKKMSKSLKNYTPPEELLNQYGADALRLYMISGGLVKGEEQRFSDQGVKEMLRRTLIPWLNAFNFLTTYTEIDGWQPDANIQCKHPLDLWVRSRLESLKARLTKQMTEYKLYNVVPELLIMIDELTNIYIRMNRPRFWADGCNDDKKAAFQTLYQCIHDISLLMAPFTPFMAEHIYQSLKRLFPNASLETSVHLCAYPKANDTLMDPLLEEAILLMDQTITLGRQGRNDNQIKVKTPLSAMTIVHEDPKILDTLKRHCDIIQQELNIKNIHIDANVSGYIQLGAKPNAPLLGKRLGKDFKIVNQAIRSLSSSQVLELDQTGSIEIEGHTISKDEIFITRQPLNNEDVILANDHVAIALDTHLTDDLISEGHAREIISNIQKTRKEIGLEVSDRIKLTFYSNDQLQDVCQEHCDYIAKETLCIDWHKSEASQPHEYSIDDLSISFLIEKV